MPRRDAMELRFENSQLWKYAGLCFLKPNSRSRLENEVQQKMSPAIKRFTSVGSVTVCTNEQNSWESIILQHNLRNGYLLNLMVM